MKILEKIREIEKEMSRTQKNKATNFHMGLLRGKLSRLRTSLIEGSKSSIKCEGFEVSKTGDARVALIGFPSVGKSTLLTKLTSTASHSASYEFTTLTCIPGIIQHNGAKIQLLDLPGIIEGASEGKGRGRQVIAVARTSNLIIMLLDSNKGEIQKKLLTKELNSVGIKLNKSPPNISLNIKKTGGISFNSTVKLSEMDRRLCKAILNDYKIFNAEILFREDAGASELIDVIEKNRKYIPCIYGYNKIDTIFMEEIEDIAKGKHNIVLSATYNLNMNNLINMIWKYLNLIRIYTKPKGKFPDLKEPFILKNGATIEKVCNQIHGSLAQNFKYALVWGLSVKHSPSQVGLNHVVMDEDVIQILST